MDVPADLFQAQSNITTYQNVTLQSANLTTKLEVYSYINNTYTYRGLSPFCPYQVGAVDKFILKASSTTIVQHSEACIVNLKYKDSC